MSDATAPQDSSIRKIAPRQKFSPRNSLRSKFLVVVLGITAAAVLIAGVTMLLHDLTVYRQSWAADMKTEAAMLARSTAPALAFSDRATAQRNLNALQVREAILGAALYDEKGVAFALYRRPGEAAIPGAAPDVAKGLRLSGELLELTQRIEQNDEFLGTIYIRARYDVSGRIAAYGTIFSIVMAASMIAALLLSTMLQRVITAPLYDIVGVARKVVDEHNYAQRVPKLTDDELGVVIEGFNKMMDEVQSRTRELEESNRTLQEEVATRQAAEAALGLANARLESSMAAAEIGGWFRNFKTGKTVVDRNLIALYGLSADEEIIGEPTLLREFVHHEDRSSVARALEEAQRSGRLETEFRIHRRDGSLRWFTSRGRVQFDENGEPATMSGLLIDTTAQRLAEQALRESERTYRAIGESIDFGVWVCDAEGRNTYASDSFLRLTGLTQEECSQFGWRSVLHPEDREATINEWQTCVRSGDNWYREHRILGVDGQYHPVLAQGVPIRVDGAITGWAGINLDISRLKRTEEALRDADRRKDEFLATLAHELRNPLAPIRHATRILDTSNASDGQRQWSRDVIARQVQHMSLLLDDLLDVSRITRGRLELKRDEVDLQSLLSMALETARPLIDSKQHTLEINLPAEPIRIDADPLRLSQALSNLLTNAAKYTDPGGLIAVTAALTEQSLNITVRDTGIGLSPSAIVKVFDMFSQVESAVDRSQGGLGIGLALVKGLVALHGGVVDAESAGVGKGSTFIIRLPISIISNRQRRAIDTVETRGSRTQRRKVLVVDDNRDGARSLALVLEMSGHDVSVAYTGASAIALGDNARPDVCIIDIGMPDLNGYETARRIREKDWGKRALLLALTGWGQQDDKQRARDAGFDRHFTKPVDPAEIERALEEFPAISEDNNADTRTQLS